MTDNIQDKEETVSNTMEITPWTVKNINEEGYHKLIDQFGSSEIDQKLIDRFEKVTKQKIHPWIKRKLFFSHRNLDELLDKYEKGENFFIYSGRGPSGGMHLGHSVPFVLTAWLQDVFKCVVIIQMSDDEKYFFKEDLSLEETEKHLYENAKDIIAFGFDIERTFIFSNLDYRGSCIEYNKNIVMTMKATKVNTVNKIFGLSEKNNIGELQWPSNQIAPCFPDSFPHIFGKEKKIMCAVVMAIDQDSYFRLSKVIAEKLGYCKQALIHGKFLISLAGASEKMSTTGSAPVSILLSDDFKTIKNKINKHAFSGGKESAELQKKYGADLEVDVSYQYLKYFLMDDEKLSDIGEKYSTGKMMTGEVKKILIDCLDEFISNHKKARDGITDEILNSFFARKDLKLN